MRAPRRGPVSDQEIEEASRLKFRKWKLPPGSVELWQKRMSETDLLLRVSLQIMTLSKSKLVDFIANLDFEQRSGIADALQHLETEVLPAFQELASAATARMIVAFAAYAERSKSPGQSARN